jgi:hypothetical protein
MTATIHSTLLRPDEAAAIGRNRIYPGYGSSSVGRAALHIPGETHLPTGKNILESFATPLNARGNQIIFPNSVQSTASTLLPAYTQNLMNEIQAGGITPLVSQSQIASRTFNAGGQLHGPAVVEGYKGVSPFGYHRDINAVKSNDWRYRSRYTTNGRSSGTKLAQSIDRNRGNFSKLGYISFTGGEQIFLNAKDKANMIVDAPISIGFEEFDDAIHEQEITVKSVNGGKSTSFTMGDLYGHGDGNRQHEIISMMSDGNHRIYGLSRGTKIGITNDARPISGLEDPLGIEVVGGYKQLKQTAYMGKDELDYFISGLKNHSPGSKYSLAVRTMSVQTKAGIAGMNARGSVDFGQLSVFKGVDSSIELNRRMRDLHGSNDLVRNVVGTYGSDLFKSVLPSMVDGKLVAGKNIQELLPFLHNSILGHVEDIRQTTGRSVILEGNLAERFRKMTNVKYVAGGEFNLTDFIQNGQFIMKDNKDIYKQHLSAAMDVFSAIRSKYETLSSDYQQGGKLIIGSGDVKDAGDILTTSWNRVTSAWKGYQENGQVLGGNTREVMWPFMAALSGMEQKELSQGAKRFNTAKFGMRDVFMFMHGKEGILDELLSRNMVDSVRLMKEKELMHLSIGGPESQKLLKERVKDYHKYLLDTYGDTAHVRDYMSVLNETTVDGAKANLSRALGTTDLNIGQIRDFPTVAAAGILAEENNPVGKLARTETGGLFHIPSAGVIGGVTVLPNGRATFEGKHGGHAAAFWEIARSAEQNGFVQTSAINPYAVGASANNITDGRAAIQIHDALYARNIHDNMLINNDAMKTLDKYMTGNTEHRSIIGNMATIDKLDAEAMIEDQLKQILFKKSNAVVLELNDIHNTWIAEDHGVFGNLDRIIRQRTKINKNGVMQTNIKGVARDIVSIKHGQSKQLHGMMKELDKLFKVPALNRNAFHIDTQIAKIANFVETHGLSSLAQRNPVIYPGSVSGMFGFIKINKVKGKANAIGEKYISLGFEAALNMKADWDGDKIQYLMMHHAGTRENVRRSVVGMQRKTSEYIRETSERMKGTKGIARMHLTPTELKAATDAVFKQKGATTAAAFITKAFTGSMNIAALATKGHLEKAINNKTITGEQLEDVLAWTRSIPSLMTEQQVISSKHLESLLSGGKAGMTKAENILGRIGIATQEDMLQIMRESGGSVHPLLQVSLAKISGNSARSYKYKRAIDAANLSLDIETGLRRINEQDLHDFKDVLGHNLTQDQWDDRVKSIMKRQEDFGVLAERESFKAAGIDAKAGLIDIFARGGKEQSNNISKIMKQVGAELEKIHDNWQTDASKEDIWESFNRHMSDYWSVSDQIFGSQGIAESSRQFRWSKQIMDKIGPAFDWITAAPARRLGGIAAVGLGIMAGANLLFGDSTPTSINDIPSRSSNPLIGASGGSYGTGGSVSGSMNLNSNVGLLSSSSAPHINVISSINSIIGNKGGHSVSVRNDNTNPYLDKMSYYN